MFRLHLNIGFKKAVNLILKKMNAGGYKIRRPSLISMTSQNKAPIVLDL